MSLAIVYLASGIIITAICTDLGLGKRLKSSVGTWTNGNPEIITLLALTAIAVFWPLWLLAVMTCVIHGERPW
jgi:hypothetical protein